MDLATRAASTIVATKDDAAAAARSTGVRQPGPCDDLIAACYASAEFREGVAAFAERRTPRVRLAAVAAGLGTAARRRTSRAPPWRLPA